MSCSTDTYNGSGYVHGGDRDGVVFRRGHAGGGLGTVLDQPGASGNSDGEEEML